jgi:hypothetical protein
MEEVNKYHNSKIYAIRSNQSEKYYIGATTQKLCKRMGGHRRHFKDNYGCISREILKYDNAYIELIENYKCESKDELSKREGELIRLHKNDLVNIQIPLRTKKQEYEDNKDKHIKRAKEYAINNKEKVADKHKQYSIDNKDKLKEYKKQYREQNKDKINEYIKCDICGELRYKSHLLRHQQTLKCKSLKIN